jgi:predicted metalloprotease with PDZ domain
MIKYSLHQKNPASHYIYIDLTIDNISGNELQLQLPAWRPGRYELGNFAKNVKRVDVFDANDKPLSFTKSTKDLWVVKTNGSKKIKVTYSYFANELNAGACYADEKQVYVNPVHLCMYIPGRMEEEHTIELDIPDNYKIATSLKTNGKTLSAANFDELADSPFMASVSIQSDFYESGGTTFRIHFNGECKPDWGKIKTDFKNFTDAQLKFWGDCPVKEYHFLFQVLPHKFYHGVEHQKSTMIVVGPGYHLNQGKTYEDILGVSSHELFHTWNIKYIRPLEMLPYDFTKENYARTGYVYEGFTTYYGDVMLRTGGVFTDEQYFETLEERLQKHFHNYGRFNLSVADSSWETWLDGYVPGVPYRKTSIYDEGNLIAFMLDILIMRNTGNKKSLKDVCRVLYNNFGKKNKGYSEQDIISICEKESGADLKDFFAKYVYGTENYEPQLIECFTHVGLDMHKVHSHHIHERIFGFKATEHPPHTKVSLVAPYSPAWIAGLSVNDDIIFVNGHTLKHDLTDWLNYYNDCDIELIVNTAGQARHLTLKHPEKKMNYFDNFKLKVLENCTDDQKNAFKKWLLNQ